MTLIVACRRSFSHDGSHGSGRGGAGVEFSGTRLRRNFREAGWGNAMRYILTGDHWSAEEAFRMGLVQQIAPTPDAALQAGVEIATKIAACGPLGIKTTLVSAHLAIDSSEADALSKLDAQYGALYRTEDFKEGRKAEAEGRPPESTAYRYTARANRARRACSKRSRAAQAGAHSQRTL